MRAIISLVTKAMGEIRSPYPWLLTLRRVQKRVDLPLVCNEYHACLHAWFNVFLFQKSVMARLSL